MNLLNSDTKPEVSEFLDNLCSLFFATYILQPTRLAKSFKTLIENIFQILKCLDLTQAIWHLKYDIIFFNL